MQLINFTSIFKSLSCLIVFFFFFSYLLYYSTLLYIATEFAFYNIIFIVVDINLIFIPFFSIVINSLLPENEHHEIKTKTAHSLENCNTYLNKLDHLKIMQVNIRSVRENFDELKLLLEQLEIPLDIKILTEIWKIGDNTLYTIKGYDNVYNHGEFNQNDGVLVYVKIT